MTTTAPPLAVTCAENISLLHLLHSVPVPPSHNPIDHFPIRRNGYTLSFERERSLTGTLAFLSGLKDGPDHIPAVCVQEDPKSAFLNVLLAVNKSKPGDGKQVLRRLKLGFERIFALLSRVLDESTPGIEDEIFAEIIYMCSVRILCRLRFIPNSRKIPKQPIKELLKEAINCIQQLKNRKLNDSDFLTMATLFIDRAKEVMKLVDAWVNHRTSAQLVKLVEGVHHLRRAGELQALLSAIPNRDMAPTSRENLLKTTRKVARYREAARFLYRTARKFSLVRKMRIVLASLPQDMFQIIPASEYSPTLPSAISRASSQHGNQGDISHVCRLLNVSEAEANNRFAEQTRNTLKNAKIHAEIQLLLYCELEGFKLPPRVVCSTKDACFLCNAFILMYGKVHTPRGHGKLYTGWRLPSSPRFKGIQERFTRELANHVRNSIATLFSRQKKSTYPDPNESTLLTLPVSLSTICSLEAVSKEERAASQPRTTNTPDADKIPSVLSNTNVLSGSSESPPSASPAAQPTDASIQPSNKIVIQITPSNVSNSLGGSLDDISVDDCALRQGQILPKRIEVNHTSPLYTAGPLEIQIEYSIGHSRNTPNEHPANLSYTIEWLTIDEAEKALQHSSSIISAESLESEISYAIDDPNCFYITARGSALKVLLQPSISGPEIDGIPQQS